MLKWFQKVLRSAWWCNALPTQSKRKPGRPLGSKNKPKTVATTSPASVASPATPSVAETPVALDPNDQLTPTDELDARRSRIYSVNSQANE